MSKAWSMVPGIQEVLTKCWLLLNRHIQGSQLAISVALSGLPVSTHSLDYKLLEGINHELYLLMWHAFIEHLLCAGHCAQL